MEGRKRPDFREFRKNYMADMRSRLKLREDQVQKLSEIMDSTEHRFGELRKRTEGEVWQRMGGEMKAISDQQRDSIRSILDASQQAEYEKMLAERAKRMKQGPPRKFGP
jgi:hypothetical protein